MNDTVRRETRLHQTDPVISRIVLVSGVDGAGFLSIATKTPNDMFGWYVSPIGDFDADGFEDLAVCAPASLIADGLGPNDPGGPIPAWRGRVVLISGATGAELMTFFNPEATADSIFGLGAAPVPDQNADGIPDLLVGGMRIVPMPTTENPDATNIELRWWVMSVATGEPIRMGIGPVGAVGCEFLHPGPPQETIEQYWIGNEAAGTRDILPGIAGDMDGDGDVDAGDAAALIGEWSGGEQGVARIGDLNGDGFVGAADLTILLSRVGFPPDLTDAFGDDVEVITNQNPCPWYGCNGGGPPPTGPIPSGPQCPYIYCRFSGLIGDDGGGGCNNPNPCACDPCACNPCAPGCGGNSCLCNPNSCACNPCLCDWCAPGCGGDPVACNWCEYFPCWPGCPGGGCPPPEGCSSCIDGFNGPDCEWCESHCAPCSPQCGINEDLYWVDIALDAPYFDQGDGELVAVAWVNDDDDNLDGVEDLAVTPPGVEQSCQSEDDLVPLIISSNLCGSVHRWRIALGYADDPEAPNPAVRIWYRWDGGIDPIYNILVPGGPVPPTLRQRIIDGVRYRQLRFDGNVAFATLSVLGDPDEMNGRIFFEFLRKGRVTIRMDVDTADPRGAVRYSSATLNGDAHSLEVHDLAAWGPGMDAQGNPTLAGAYLDSISNREVGGAITDGASPCLLRLDSPETGISPTQLTMMKRGSQPGDPDPIQVSRQIGGTMHSPNPAALPPLPTPGDTTAQPTIELESGKAFYVPPDSYIDPSRALWLTAPQVSHDTQETCLMSIVGSLPDGQVMRGGRSFVLRRPPIVLVHGIMSSPATWGTNQYSEMLGTPVPARLYRVDYSSTATKGYSENFDHVPRMISSALRDYRNALDDSPDHHPSRGFRGVKYAATRADVIGHSQGGQLTRTYISTLDWSNFGPQARTRDGAATQRPAALFFRSEYERYLRPNNWGAGDIRRFIPIGSPFKGSPWANVVEPFLEPKQANYDWHHVMMDTEFIQDLSCWDVLYPGGPATAYTEPTCLADLRVDSRVQTLLESPTAYPIEHKKVQWAPMVGIATQGVADAPVQGALWELLFSLIPWLPSDPEEIEPLSPAACDLVVSEWSQRNAFFAGDISNANPDWSFQFHIHAGVPVVGSNFQTETESDAISVQIGKLLSQPKSSFANGGLH